MLNESSPKCDVGQARSATQYSTSNQRQITTWQCKERQQTKRDQAYIRYAQETKLQDTALLHRYTYNMLTPKTNIISIYRNYAKSTKNCLSYSPNTEL